MKEHVYRDIKTKKAHKQDWVGIKTEKAHKQDWDDTAATKVY